VGAGGAAADDLRAVGGGVGHDASVDEAHPLAGRHVGAAAERVERAVEAGRRGGHPGVGDGGERDADRPSHRCPGVHREARQLGRAARRAVDHRRRPAVAAAAVRVGLQVLDEVDRHRQAARARVRRVADVRDDGEGRVRELRGGGAPLLHRRVAVEVTRLDEDRDVRQRPALQG
jgi:hypothetical protein